MARKVNCWEFRNCGMEPGGIYSRLYGECPVPKMMKYDGANHGSGAGRLCWQIVKSGPGGRLFICRNNRVSCLQCDFYRRVRREEEDYPSKELADEPFSRQKLHIS